MKKILGLQAPMELASVNTATVVAASFSTDVDPTHPSGLKQVNRLASDMVGQGGEALGSAGDPHFV